MKEVEEGRFEHVVVDEIRFEGGKIHGGSKSPGRERNPFRSKAPLRSAYADTGLHLPSDQTFRSAIGYRIPGLFRGGEALRRSPL